MIAKIFLSVEIIGDWSLPLLVRNSRSGVWMGEWVFVWSEKKIKIKIHIYMHKWSSEKKKKLLQATTYYNVGSTYDPIPDLRGLISKQSSCILLQPFVFLVDFSPYSSIELSIPRTQFILECTPSEPSKGCQ